MRSTRSTRPRTDDRLARRRSAAAFAGTAQAYQASLANEPILIAAALAAVYIVLGILYESFIHPITILTTLPSAGVGAVLALLITGTDLSLIAVIGIILLIGIVKKNAIMMIDFALAAERNEGKNSRDAIFEACQLRFRPIMMTTMAAMFGAVPAGLRYRHRVRTAPAARHRDHRRPARQPDADALHHAGDLSLLGPARASGGTATPRDRSEEPTACPSARKLEHDFPIHLSLLGFALSACIGPAAPLYRLLGRARLLRPAHGAHSRRNYKEPGDWKPAQPKDDMIRGKWWEIYHDPQLNALEEQVNISNQNVLQAEAQFREAAAAVKVARAAFFPTVTANPAFTESQASQSLTSGGIRRQRRSGGRRRTRRFGRRAASMSDAPDVSLYDLPVEATYMVDIWGSVRRNVEANSATAQASFANLENARLVLPGDAGPGLFQPARPRCAGGAFADHGRRPIRNFST